MADQAVGGIERAVWRQLLHWRRVENAQLKHDNIQLQQEYTQLQQKNIQSIHENSQLQQENTELQQKNIQLKHENTQLQQENTQLQQENDRIKPENAGLQQELATASENVALLVAHFASKYNGLRSQHASATETLQARISELETYRNNAQKEIFLRFCRMGEMAARFGSCEGRVKALQERNAELELDLEIARDETATSKAEQDKVLSEIRGLQAQLDDSTEQLDELMERNTELELELEIAQDEAAMSKAEQDKMASEMDYLRTQLDDSAEQVQSLGERIAELEHDCETARNNAAISRAEQDKVASEISVLRHQVTAFVHIKEQLEAAQMENTNLKEQDKINKATLQKALQRAVKTDQELHASQIANTVLQKRVISLEEKLVELKTMDEITIEILDRIQDRLKDWTIDVTKITAHSAERFKCGEQDFSMRLELATIGAIHGCQTGRILEISCANSHVAECFEIQVDTNKSLLHKVEQITNMLKERIASISAEPKNSSGEY